MPRGEAARIALKPSDNRTVNRPTVRPETGRVVKTPQNLASDPVGDPAPKGRSPHSIPAVPLYSAPITVEEHTTW